MYITEKSIALFIDVVYHVPWGNNNTRNAQFFALISFYYVDPNFGTVHLSILVDIRKNFQMMLRSSIFLEAIFFQFEINNIK